jgi:hypothetical protein
LLLAFELFHLIRIRLSFLTQISTQILSIILIKKSLYSLTATYIYNYRDVIVSKTNDYWDDINNDEVVYTNDALRILIRFSCNNFIKL